MKIAPERERVAYRPSGQPVYLGIAQDLQTRIDSGLLRPGAQLPAEPELARQYAVSRPTVRQALDELMDRGAIHRVRGVGTFVRRRVVENSEEPPMGFTEQLRQQGFTASARILTIRRCRSPRVARRLDLPISTVFAQIRRVHHANGEPVALNTYYLVDPDRHPVSAAKLGTGSLYEYLASQHGVQIAEADRTVRAGLASVSVARMLRIPVARALLLIERIDYRVDGMPIGYAESSVRGDRYTIRTHIVTDPRSRPWPGRSWHG